MESKEKDKEEDNGGRKWSESQTAYLMLQSIPCPPSKSTLRHGHGLRHRRLLLRHQHGRTAGRQDCSRRRCFAPPPGHGGALHLDATGTRSPGGGAVRPQGVHGGEGPQGERGPGASRAPPPPGAHPPLHAPLPPRGRQADPADPVHRRLRARRWSRGRRHARRLRRRDDPHHVADPRRPPLHGQRRPAPRPAHQPRPLRRGHGHTRRRRPPLFRLRARRRQRCRGGAGAHRPRHTRARQFLRIRGPSGWPDCGHFLRGEGSGHGRVGVHPHPQDGAAAGGGGGVRGDHGRRGGGGGGAGAAVRAQRGAAVPGGGRHPGRDEDVGRVGEDGGEGPGQRQDHLPEAARAGRRPGIRSHAGAPGRGGARRLRRRPGRAPLPPRPLHSQPPQLKILLGAKFEKEVPIF